VVNQFFWGLDCVNHLIERGDNSTGSDLGVAGSDLGDRIYAITDANYNVTGLVDTSGNVLQRFMYGAYGTMTVLDANYNTTTDGYNWQIGFQGGMTDPVTGLVHFDARDYNPATGRWMEQDPTGAAYVDGASLYQAFDSNSAAHVDPFGLASQQVAGAQYIQYEMTPGPGVADNNRAIGLVTVELLADGPDASGTYKLSVHFNWEALTNYQDQAAAANLGAVLFDEGNGNFSKLTWVPNKGPDGNSIPLLPNDSQSVMDPKNPISPPGNTSGTISVGTVTCPNTKKGTVGVGVVSGKQKFVLYQINWSATAGPANITAASIDFSDTKAAASAKGAVYLDPWDPDHGGDVYPGQWIRKKEKVVWP